MQPVRPHSPAWFCVSAAPVQPRSSPDPARATAAPSPQMAAQEVLGMEHWLATHQWHSPSCAAWPGHDLGNTGWLGPT